MTFEVSALLVDKCTGRTETTVEFWVRVLLEMYDSRALHDALLVGSSWNVKSPLIARCDWFMLVAGSEAATIAEFHAKLMANTRTITHGPAIEASFEILLMPIQAGILPTSTEKGLDIACPAFLRPLVTRLAKATNIT